MPEFIDKNKLLAKRTRVVEYDEAGFDMCYHVVSVDHIDKEPVIHIVFCKDCKQNEIIKNGCLYSWCKYHKKSVMEDDFCSFGEEKS